MSDLSERIAKIIGNHVCAGGDCFARKNAANIADALIAAGATLPEPKPDVVEETAKEMQRIWYSAEDFAMPSANKGMHELARWHRRKLRDAMLEGLHSRPCVAACESNNRAIGFCCECSAARRAILLNFSDVEEPC